MIGWKSNNSIMTTRCNMKNSLTQVFPTKVLVFGGPAFLRILPWPWPGLQSILLKITTTNQGLPFPIHLIPQNPQPFQYTESWQFGHTPPTSYIISPSYNILQKMRQGRTLILELIFLGKGSLEMMKRLRHLCSSLNRWRPFVLPGKFSEDLISRAISASPRMRSTFAPLAVRQKVMGKSNLL